ncbi:hypothetical protein E4U22_005814 [Claviceps purpurea]|uniref:Cytochrome c oxidase subunit 9, mitochondrial n=4 Tax=Claviceps TaxID=5110 RepID=M1W8A7_CLAP2|nr:hypothetical protein E4U58_004667 [Claviceps cyperi]KAG5965356.1 hypothetical protein E4U57_004193 [Claviceps arundinis]KAG5988197.1 hypothetical protein E4U52_006819 [Claviceps spartinae]KAG6028764.1 hypothetical protein E4U19_001330 [Claviceps sp. Clav32 group G5]KAG6033195.1 hypothetical protein E4U40_005604 [Claviceps sp. LM458 group G5]KAG6050103.1 hypothetical protein E4U39_004815 [Claviceps sp. Clav50 group G5]KAG6059092.1 hypothetical protein E4U32_004231 [Claviceps aff. humidiphil
MAIAPITGMVKRRLISDLTIGIGSGLIFANIWWYGFHIPRNNLRDDYYAKLEAERIEARKQ